MSSYVAVTGIPTGETCSIFGLTPQEVRYLQSKFPDGMKHDVASWNPAHGIRLECACIVVLNALGYIGFKVISASGDKTEYLWTMERNLDMDTHFQSREAEMARYHSQNSLHKHSSAHFLEGKPKKGSGGAFLQPPTMDKEQRRHSLSGRLAAALNL